MRPVGEFLVVIAGKDVANPIGAILSMAMLLRDGCALPRPAAAIEAAVERVLADGLRTVDLAVAGAPSTSCSAFAKAAIDSVASAPA